MDLGYRERTDHGVPVLALAGDVDLATLPSLYERVNRFVIAVEAPCAVIDLSDVVAMQPVALGVLLDARLQLRAAARELELVCANEAIWSLFVRSGLDATFTHHASVADACSGEGRA